MRGHTRLSCSLTVLLALPTLAASLSQPSGNLSGQDIVSKWRNAVHATKGVNSKLAVLASDSNQDGIAGRVEEWITVAGAYRSAIKRDYDDGELVVTEQFAKRRDWNGFVREVQD